MKKNNNIVVKLEYSIIKGENGKAEESIKIVGNELSVKAALSTLISKMAEAEGVSELDIVEELVAVHTMKVMEDRGGNPFDEVLKKTFSNFDKMMDEILNDKIFNKEQDKND